MRQLCSFCCLHWFLVLLSFRFLRIVPLFHALHFVCTIVLFFITMVSLYLMIIFICFIQLFLLCPHHPISPCLTFVFSIVIMFLFCIRVVRSFANIFGHECSTMDYIFEQEMCGMENEWHLRKLLVPFYFKIKYGPHRAEQTIHELCLIARRGSTRLIHFVSIFMFIAFHCLMRNTNVCIL